MVKKTFRQDEVWQQQLTAEQYHITREAGTERAFTGAYWDHHEPGIYRCLCCDLELFHSAHKFDSGSGWPSFFQSIAAEHILHRDDHSLGMVRTELLCAGCDAHLGHLFADGPPPSGQRYCINSAALKFFELQT